MRKFTLLTTLLIAMAISINAQITNSGFENWTTVGSYEDPTGWATNNSSCAGTFYSCTQSTEHYPVSVGNYSIRLENDTSIAQFLCGWGLAATMPSGLKPSFPISGHPNNLCGYYKYNSLNNDSMQILILFFQNGTMTGYNTFTTGITTLTWTSFIIPLTYTLADSATISLSAYNSGMPKGNSVLYIDNLSFDNLISSISKPASKKSLFDLYPNPAADIVTLNIDNVNNTDLTLNIYNVVGTLVKSEMLKQNNRQINIGDLSNGIYMVEIKSKEWTKKQKLIIQR